MSDNTARRLFIFCIGGTGSRVLKALTFLLATGAEINAATIVPIIIDPDKKNGDLNRTLEILKTYQDIYNELEFEKNKFFKTEIKTLASVNDDKGTQISAGFKFDFIDGNKDGKFKDFIEYSTLNGSNKDLVDALFSDANLDADLKVGFKGNPHMGSIVLNQFKDKEDFKAFASVFRPGDRIFIINSIFGGTGAAGFPLLVKNLREADKLNIQNFDWLINAPIGTLTVKPYFGVKPDENSEIDKGTFISKTKAALSYYNQKLLKNHTVNVMYYIGDDFTKDYENAEGQSNQKNDAHLVEFLGATAILDFMKISDEKLDVDDGRTEESLVKGYGMFGNTTTLSFKNLGKKTKARVMQGLSQYMYCCKYWNQQIEKSIDKRKWSKGSNNSSVKINSKFLKDDFFDVDLRQFNSRFIEWLTEMQENQRAFKPFRLDANEKQLYKLLEDVEQKKMNIFKGAQWSYADFDSALSEAEGKVGELNVEQKFMAIFYLATKSLYDQRIAQTA